MASTLKEFYEFLKDPLNPELQNKIRHVDFEKVEDQIYDECFEVVKDSTATYLKDSCEAFSRDIIFGEKRLLIIVKLLLQFVDDKTPLSDEEVESVLAFLNEFGFVKTVENILKTVALTTDQRDKLSPKTYPRIKSVETTLKRSLTPEKAGYIKKAEHALDAGSGLVCDDVPSCVPNSPEKNPSQNEIDKSFDIMVTNALEQARSSLKLVKFDFKANVLLKQISPAQIDKTLNDVIEALNFGCAHEVLEQASPDQISCFLIRLVSTIKEDSFLDKWFLRWAKSLNGVHKDELYRAAESRGYLKTMQAIRNRTLFSDEIGLSLVAVIKNTELEICSGEKDKIVCAILESQSQPSSDFINEALSEAARRGLGSIIDKLSEKATTSGRNNVLIVAVESNYPAIVKVLRNSVTDEESINTALDRAFGLKSEIEQHFNSKLMIVTYLLGGKDWLHSPHKHESFYMNQLSTSINTLKIFEKNDTFIKKICADLDRAEKALQLGCRSEDVQSYLSMMKTKKDIVEARSRFPYNLKTVQNTLTALLSIISCLSGIAIPFVRRALNDNLEQRGGMFRFFHKGDKQALEIAEHQFNVLLEKKDNQAGVPLN